MGASEGISSRCTQQLRTRSSSPAPNNSCWVMARFGMPRWRCGLPGNSDCVPPAGWAEAGGANQPHGMSVRSFLAGCVLSPRDDGTVCRWWGWCAAVGAAVGAAAGALASRCWLSGTPSWLERAPAWGPPAVVSCLMASAQIWSVRCSPSPRGGFRVKYYR